MGSTKRDLERVSKILGYSGKLTDENMEQISDYLAAEASYIAEQAEDEAMMRAYEKGFHTA